MNTGKERHTAREAQILRERRIELGLTQMQVALTCGIELQQYQRFEYGTRSLAKTRMVIGLKICAVLELDPYDLLFFDSAVSQ